MSSKVKLVIFSGGRGTASICDALKRHHQIDLTVLVNTYDDGLSTGQVRRLIPGMLGPSDIRKNISYFIPLRDRADRSLQRIIEYRLPRSMCTRQGREVIQAIANGRDPEDSTLAQAFGCLRQYQSRLLASYASSFLAYYDRQPESRQAGLVFADCSVGNLLFAGCYLLSNRDFNRTVAGFSATCEITPAILNVTDGTSAILVGLKSDGQFLPDEASIVSPQNSTRVSELFLLPDYLSKEEAVWAKSAGFDALRRFLQSREFFPKLNPSVRQALAEADLIIYGPGTQHSSLLPSYLTEDIGKTIAANRHADKVFVCNIASDYEIQGETANSLVGKVLHYLNGKARHSNSARDLITTALVQVSSLPEGKLEASSPASIPCNAGCTPFDQIRTVSTDWNDGSGKHAGSRILEELTRIINTHSTRRLARHPYMVSIIVPGLNEERTIRDVLLSLSRVDFDDRDLKIEIIYVDGGSTDSSLEEARSAPGVRIFRLQGKSGRGMALRLGIEKAVGNVVAFFPSDGEYDVRDLIKAVAAVVDSGERIVFGSRTIKCLNLNRLIHQIYKGNYLGYLVSKYGGMLVSLIALLMHNRYVSDIFTGIKAFDAGTLRGFELKGRGLDLETEILAKACHHHVFILEIPVRFAPRTRLQGKKTTVRDGLKAIWSLFWWGTLRPLTNRMLGRLVDLSPVPEEEITTWPITSRTVAQESGISSRNHPRQAA